MRLSELARCFLGALPLAGALSFGCLTINIYFPEAEIREAAGEIVDEVRPEVVETGQDGGQTAPANDPDEKAREAPPEAKAQSAGKPKERGAFLAFFGLRAAHAEEKDGKLKLDISSPVIKKIKETLKKRYAQLLPFYQKGAVGEGVDGYLAERDSAGLSLKEKRDLQTLLKEENADRKSLYTEIAQANKIDESNVPGIGQLFSKEWQEKCKEGWWIETGEGKWEKKKVEKGKK